MGKLVGEHGLDLLRPKVAKERVGDDDTTRPSEAHDRRIRTTGLLGGAEFEHAHDGHIGLGRERFEPGSEGRIFERSEAEEQGHEDDRRKECEDDGDGKAQEPRGEPPPDRPDAEQPEQDGARGHRRSEPEPERLRKILHPSSESLGGEPEPSFQAVSADVAKREIDGRHDGEQEDQEHDRGGPRRHPKGDDPISQRARPTEDEGQREPRDDRRPNRRQPDVQRPQAMRGRLTLDVETPCVNRHPVTSRVAGRSPGP